MRPLRIAVALLMGMLLLTSVALAQSGGGYDLAWHTIDGGGAVSTGGNFALGGTIGQPDAARLSGGDFTLVGGFWGGSFSQHGIYLPLTLHPG